MPRTAKPKAPAVFVAEWPLPAAATLGSSVRARGILLEIRAKLPSASRKWLDVTGSILTLGAPEGSEAEYRAAAAVVEKHLIGVENLPIIPREIEDILSIKTSERHRWLKDGRLPSAGTRTVKLRGRARKITFHVFDPRRVEDILDADRVPEWREADAETAAENRRKAAWKRKLIRLEKAVGEPAEAAGVAARPRLAGWEDFEREGLLR